MDQLQFQKACQKVVGIERERKQIGTLGEKTLHAVVKNYLEPMEEHQEVKVGSFHADIYNDSGIMEVQTRNFNQLRKKLDVFLELCPVTIVYPIPYIKWLFWIDEETGEVSKKRKSPKKGKIHISFSELYKIKQFLDHPNMQVKILLINMEEYRLLNGWSQDKKKGSTRFDRIPTELVEEYDIYSSGSYKLFFPETLKEPFTTKDFSKEAKIPVRDAQLGLHIMNYIHAVEKVGKQGRLNLYQYGGSKKE